jgi:hypothetical protein
MHYILVSIRKGTMSDRATVIIIPANEAAIVWTLATSELREDAVLSLAHNRQEHDLTRGDIVSAELVDFEDPTVITREHFIFDGHRLVTIPTIEEVDTDEDYGQVPEQFKVPSQFPPKYWSDANLPVPPFRSEINVSTVT